MIGDELRGNLEPDAATTTNWVGNHLLTWLAVALHGRTINVLCSGFWGFSEELLRSWNSTALDLKSRQKCILHQQKEIFQFDMFQLVTQRERVSQNLGSVKDGASAA